MAETKHFAFIPKRTTHSKELNSLPISARWLYVVMIAERGGFDAEFRFSYTEMRRITGMSRTTIRKAIKALIKAEYTTCQTWRAGAKPEQVQAQYGAVDTAMSHKATATIGMDAVSLRRFSWIFTKAVIAQN